LPVRLSTKTTLLISCLAAIAFTFSCPAANAASYLFKTPALNVTVSSDPLGVIVTDVRDESVLAHVPGSGLYVQPPDGPIAPLSGCKEKTKRGDKSVVFTCTANTDEITVAFEMLNDYEFSMTMETPQHKSARRLGHRFALPAGESIYGIKEHVEGDGKSGSDAGDVKHYATLDQRGSRVEMYTRPTVSIYSPFHINSRGYALFFDTSWPGWYDLGDTDPDVLDVSFEGARLSMVFTFGPGMEQILERHSARVGRSLLPPKWAAEVFKWRDDHINLTVLYDNSIDPSPYNSMVYEDIMMLRKLGIPTGVYWLDRPWAKGPFGYDDFTFDENRFPKPKEMIEWLLDKNGMETLLWVAPWIYGETRELAQKRGYIAPNSDKVIDFTNPDAVTWWQSEYKKVFDLNVAGFKLDRCEEVIPSTEQDIYFDGRSGRELHNLYPMLYAKAVQGACQKYRGDDCLVMPRSGFTGSQQYAVFWGGDTHPSWRGLRSAIISAERANLMGFPVWGSDTGGYGVSETQDLFSRWMQASSLHPIMEVGGSGSHEPWNAGYEPNYDQIGIDNYRIYAKLHTELIPYNYSAMYEAHDTGHPIVRALVYEWPEDARVRDMWDEWLFGNWILAAPVTVQGARSREVYLPQGTWFDFWDMKDEYQGNRNYLVDAPITRMPIFIRGGAIIPLKILDAETGWGAEFTKDAFAIAFFPAGGESSFLLYDNGKEMPVTMKETEEQILIDTSAVAEPALLRVRAMKPRSISVNGKEIEKCRDEKEFAAAAAGYTWDSPAREVWIKVPANGKVVIDK